MAKNTEATATSKGIGMENELPPVEQMKPAQTSVTHEGPQVGSTNEYKPATYASVVTVPLGKEGESRTYEIVRSDR